MIGEFRLPESGEVFSHMRIVIPAADFTLDWRRYNLVSNYIAEYSSYHFEQKDKAENLISTVFYELIGYLSSTSKNGSILDIRFSTVEQWLVFEISATLETGEIVSFKELLTEINRSDLDDYYKSVLEEDMEEPHLQKKLGMAMIAHDYRAQLTASLHEENGNATVRALVRQEEITQ
jgi:hypothetical protein